MVDLFLAIAHDLKGTRFVELELRPAVQGREGLTVELERHRHHRPRGVPMHFLSHAAVACDRHDLRMLENRRIELGHLLGLAVNPKARRDLLYLWHGESP